MAFDSKEVILGNILSETHIGLAILYCPKNIYVVMTIWKWLIIQTILNGTSLHALLYSYDRSYVLEVDEEGAVGAKKKKNTFNKRKRKESESKHPILRMKKILSNVCHDVGAKMCCSLNYC